MGHSETLGPHAAKVSELIYFSLSSTLNKERSIKGALPCYDDAVETLRKRIKINFIKSRTKVLMQEVNQPS